MSTPRSLLDVTGLGVRFGHRRIEAVRDVSFSLDAGQRLGVIGESGSGKTVTALAVMGLLPDNARVSGSVVLDGREVVGLAEQDLAWMRGRVLVRASATPEGDRVRLRIRVADTRYAGFGIDTPEDLERARAILAAQGV